MAKKSFIDLQNPALSFMSLTEEQVKEQSVSTTIASGSIIEIPLSELKANDRNSEIFSMEDRRVQTLAADIKERGLSNPIKVKRLEDGMYEIIEGHTRVNAVRLNGDTKIKAIVEDIEGDEKTVNSMIMSNIQTRRLNAMEEARAMQVWWDTVAIPRKERGELKGEKKDIVAEKWGVSASSVSKKLSLLKLIPELQKILETSEVNYVAFLPVAQKTEDEQKEFYNKIKDISVEELTLPNIEAILEGKVKKNTKEKAEEKQVFTKMEKATNTFMSSVKRIKELTSDDKQKIQELMEYLNELLNQ